MFICRRLGCNLLKSWVENKFPGLPIKYFLVSKDIRGPGIKQSFSFELERLKKRHTILKIII